MAHWTTNVYRHNGHLLHDVEAAIFQNEILTDFEIEVLRHSAAAMGREIAAPVLDLACGPGRHTIRLAGEGLAVTGIDLSETFLGIARSAADRLNGNGNRPRFACGDMRLLPTRDSFYRTAVLLGNSFGYFPENQNLRILREVYRTLDSGGFFCMEITDREAYLPTLKSFEEESIDSNAFGKLDSSWSKTWDASTQRVNTWESHRRHSTGEVLYEGSYDLRLYGREEISHLLEQVGFNSVTYQSRSPSELELQDGLGETLGAASEVLFVGAVK